MRERGFMHALAFYTGYFPSVFTLSLAFYSVIFVVAAASVVELGWLGLLAIAYLMLASIFWQQAPLARLMDDARAHRPHRGIRRTFETIFPRLGSVTGGTAVAALAVLVATSFFVLPGLVVLARLALFIPVIVIEGCGAFRAFGRSNRLVHGHMPRVLLELVISIIVMTVIWSIAFVLLAVESPWLGLPLAIVFLALVTPPVPLMRILSYYDLVEAETKLAKNPSLPAPV